MGSLRFSLHIGPLNVLHRNAAFNKMHSLTAYSIGTTIAPSAVALGRINTRMGRDLPRTVELTHDRLSHSYLVAEL